MKLDTELTTKERAEWHLMSKIDVIQRRIVEVEEGALLAIVSDEAVEDIIKSYERDLKMFNYLKNLIQ